MEIPSSLLSHDAIVPQVESPFYDNPYKVGIPLSLLSSEMGKPVSRFTTLSIGLIKARELEAGDATGSAGGEAMTRR